MSSAFSVNNENNEYIEKLSAEFTGYNMEDGRKRLLPELHQVEPKRGSGGVIRFFRTKNLVGGSRELPPPNRTARTGQVSRSSIND